jgi:membrane protease YdiL (CAAX protease family)
MTQKNKLISALLLNFALSWGLAGIAKLLGLSYSGTNIVIIGVLYMLMPALSLFILSKFFWKVSLKEWGLRKPKAKLLFASWGYPYILALLTLFISLLIPGVKLQPGMEGMFAKYEGTMPSESLAVMRNQINSLGPMLPIIIIIQSIVGGLTVNSIAAFGEEYFWRGFLLKELKKTGWLKSSLIIGTIWGLWHAPLILQGHNYPQHPVFGVLMMVIWCILISFPLIYFTAKTKSVLTAAFFHGIINASAGMAILWVGGGSDLVIGVTGLAGFIALIVLNLILFIIDKKSSQQVDCLLNDY